MANYLKVAKRQQVTALLELGWSYRRIEQETGVRRETVSRYDRQRRANAAKVFAGSEGSERAPEGVPPGWAVGNPAKVFAGSAANAAKVFPGSRPRQRPSAEPFEETIRQGLDQGLSIQRIWQDLVAELGYGQSYESVTRFVRRLSRDRVRPATVLHAAPGEEVQVDFFQGAPTFHADSGQWRRPWVFRMTLSHSRHGYEEAVWDQRLETFLRLHERAFHDIGGVPRVVRHDNLPAAVVRSCLYDPDVHPVYAAFAQHWGFTPLPSRPRRPQENGKQERSGGYVKDNALKARRFASLAEQNAWLRHWNQTIARLRIHGTTRRQVWTHFLESDQPTLNSRATYVTCASRGWSPPWRCASSRLAASHSTRSSSSSSWCRQHRSGNSDSVRAAAMIPGSSSAPSPDCRLIHSLRSRRFAAATGVSCGRVLPRIPAGHGEPGPAGARAGWAVPESRWPRSWRCSRKE